MSNTLSQIGTKVGTEFKAHRLRIETLEDALDSKITSTEKGVANGVATLGATGKVPSSQLPSYVDDVVEAANLASFPATGESGKIYVALDTNKTYRWSGSAYVYITSGAVDSVAGKTGIVTLVKSDVGLGNVDNTSDANKPVSTAVQAALDTKLASNSYTASDVLTKIKTVDGSGSGLDADLLDGLHASAFATAAQGTKADNALPATSYTAADVLTKIKTVDGSGSGLDADLLDGLDSTAFVTKDTDTGAAKMPVGNTAQRPSTNPSGAYAYIRYNSEFGQWEGSPDGATWSGLGGATGGAGNPAFYENDNTITANYTITTGKNAMTAGPITVNNGVTVTIPDGSTWTVV